MCVCVWGGGLGFESTNLQPAFRSSNDCTITAICTSDEKPSHRQSPGGERRGKRKCPTVFPERTRKGHRRSREHWNCLKGNVRERSGRRGGAHMGFSDRVDTILN